MSCGCGFGASCGEDHSRCERDNVVALVDSSASGQTERRNEWAAN